MALDDFEGIMHRAIHKEQQAHDLYLRVAKMVEAKDAQALLKDLAAEEAEHKRLLAKLMETSKAPGSVIRFNKPLDQKIFDTLEAKPVSSDSTYRDILVFAAREEQEASDYYAHMAGRLDDGEAKTLLENLSRWELNHKAKLEREYDEFVYREM